jgi:hypothetical protein
MNILEALDEALRKSEGVDGVVRAFYDLAGTADGETRDRMLTSLERFLREYPGECTATVAVLAGAFVELGADPKAFPAAVFDRLVEVLEAIEVDDAAGSKDADAEESGPPECFYEFERAAMACLSRSPELRRALPQKRAIVANLRRYEERYGFLGKMIQVLDDEPLVLVSLVTGKGYRFRMHGIADNFQLHALLLGALAGGELAGIAPSREALAAAGEGPFIRDAAEPTVQSDWQLANWTGARAGFALGEMRFKETWIWNEGVPADIAAFEGTRVVLLARSTYTRSWNATRVFPGMRGALEGPVAMPEDEVRGLLRRMGETV